MQNCIEKCTLLFFNSSMSMVHKQDISREKKGNFLEFNWNSYIFSVFAEIYAIFCQFVFITRMIMLEADLNFLGLNLTNMSSQISRSAGDDDLHPPPPPPYQLVAMACHSCCSHIPRLEVKSYSRYCELVIRTS